MKNGILISLLCFFTVQLSYAEGTEPTDSDLNGKREVSSLDHLLWIATNDPGFAYSYEQTADIDASGTQYWDDSDDDLDGNYYNDPNDLTETGNNEGWLPIGNGTTPFTGNYSGQGFVITGITINRSANFQGLFGQTSGSLIEDLGIESGNIAGADYTGGMVGVSVNSTIVNCYTNCQVNGASEVGGMAGRSYASILDNCVTSGKVHGEQRVGGLVGYSRNISSLNKCHSDSHVSASFMDCGGLVGYNSESAIDSCYAQGNVSGYQITGGLVGQHQSGVLGYCYATGFVSGYQHTGGLVGSLWTATILYSYANGNVSGSGTNAGGLVGKTYGVSGINNSYALGDVFRTAGTDTAFGAFAGYNHPSTSIDTCYSIGSVFYEGADDPTMNGFVGSDEGAVYTSNYWDRQHSIQLTAIGASGVNTTGMKIQFTFVSDGWDFTGESVNGTFDTWSISSGDTISYPYLTLNEPDTLPGFKDELYAGGEGTSENPYQVQTLMHLNNVKYNPDAWYIQTADIDASETSSWDDGNGGDPEGWLPNGNYYTRFTGTYNGKNHIITGLTIQRPGEDYQGLFGYIDNASLDSIGVEDVSISGSWHVGGMVGILDNNSSLYACYATGEVTGTQEVGGLAGWNESSAIDACFAHTAVSASRSNAGGLAGANYTGAITNSYSMGDVTRITDTYTNFGAFVGVNEDNSISNCYATGSVFYEGATDPTDKGFVGTHNSGTYTGNFWDSQSSNQSTATGATGNSTAAMQTQSTYTDAGWDFMDETTNGTDDYWGINPADNNAYPFLKWQGYKLHAEVTEWPVAGNLACGETLAEVVLTGGTATIDGTFAFAEPDMSPVYGTNPYEMEFTPTDNENYAVISGFVDVTVEDNTDPQILSTHDDQTIPSDAGCQAVLPDYTVDVIAEDICDAELTITQAPVAGTSIEGPVNTVILMVTDDALNTVEVNFNVAVEDQTDPEITSSHNDVILEANTECEAQLPDYTGDVEATDNCDPDPVITQSPEAGTFLSGAINEITLTVTDEAGNTAEVTFNVEVTDNTLPTITCVEDKVVDADGSGVYTVSGTLFDPASTNDNCGVGSIENDFNAQSSLDGASLPVGTTTVVWTVTDNSGNSTTCSVDITVNSAASAGNLKTETLSIYPNPANDKIEITGISELLPGGKTLNISITDIAGNQFIRSETGSDQKSVTLDVSCLGSGIYMIRIFSDNAVLTETFVKE